MSPSSVLSDLPITVIGIPMSQLSSVKTSCVDVYSVLLSPPVTTASVGSLVAIE